VSMFKNMVICVEILFSLDISVKYAQCVKIWLFLKCVQFTKVLCSVSSEVCALVKEKGDTPIERVSRILVKRDVPTECTLWSRVSLLLYYKKTANRIFPTRLL
jgi:hypothetical protein